MKKYFISLFVFFSILFANSVYAEVSAGSGFIPGQIWYSEETLIDGNTVNIHTAVWNGEKNKLSAKVEFYDKNVILGSRDVVLAPLELKDVFIPWKITAGDHVISAKIISSEETVSGKAEKVTLRRTATSSDKQSVSVTAKNEAGEAVNVTDSLNNLINKTGDLLPESVVTPVSNSFTVVDNFREKTSTQMNGLKDEAKETIAQINEETNVEDKPSTEKVSTEEAIKKPIAYIKLFLFTVLAFVFGHKIIFYGVLILVIFYVLRAIYRAIRNR